ncbi:MAG: mycothiol system anti-sigma-R factor [Rothia sp. (in: high G+C Gram-positive bacteria)]|nr:mycothiol system anti-sigma-R factor [Rothia sp. (in: high G+C Gram-positive bacteria)]
MSAHVQASSTPCEERLARIYTYLDDPLSCQDLEELQAHLAQCQTCAQEYDLECLIRQAIRRTCKEQAPQDLKSRIRSSIEDFHQQGHRPLAPVEGAEG